MAGEINAKIPISYNGGLTSTPNLAASGLSNGTTGSGNIVLKTSPTITTPIIGQINGTNNQQVCTFLDVASVADYFSFQSNIANSASISCLSSNSNASFSIFAKGTGGVVIGSSGATTAPLAVQAGANTVSFSIPALTGNRTLTYPDGNVTLQIGTQLVQKNVIPMDLYSYSFFGGV